MKKKKITAKKGALCAWCKKYARIGDKWVPLQSLGLKPSDFESHGICPPCAEALKREYVSNPPVFVGSKATWEKAKKIVKQSYPNIRPGPRFYAIVTDIYQKIGGKIKRRAKGNPSVSEWNQVIDLFRTWSGFEPSEVIEMSMYSRTIPRYLVKLGDLAGVIYESDKWDGKPIEYIHEFKVKSKRPILCADANGQLYIIGGNYKVTHRGIV